MVISIERFPEPEDNPLTRQAEQTNDFFVRSPAQSGHDVVETQQQKLREEEDAHEPIGDVNPEEAVHEQKYEDERPVANQESVAEKPDVQVAEQAATVESSPWLTEEVADEVPRTPEVPEQQQSEPAERPIEREEVGDERSADEQSAEYETDAQAVARDDSITEVGEAEKPADVEPDDGLDKVVLPVIEAQVAEIDAARREIAVEEAEAEATAADMKDKRTEEDLDDDRAITDGSLVIRESRWERMMKELNENHKPLQDIPLEKVDITKIEQPAFGNSNEPPETTKHFAELIRGLGQKQLVLCAEQFGFAADSRISATADFKEIPEFAEGREQSRHGVKFGRLTIETQQDHPKTVYVAMKPYDKRGKDSNFGARPDRAVAHDWATNMHLRRLSKHSAYEPIGVWRGEGTFPVPGLITRFNERSLSLDNLLRNISMDEHGEPDLELSQVRARQALHLGHFGLGVAHGIHVSHGDASPQNLATDGSYIIFNDTTTMNPFSTTKRRNEIRVNGDMHDFVSGAIHPDVTTVEMRALTGRALKDIAFRTSLYRTYLAGAALGAQRAGYSQSDGVLLPESEHEEIVDRYVQKYVPAG